MLEVSLEEGDLWEGLVEVRKGSNSDNLDMIYKIKVVYFMTFPTDF